MPRAGERPGRSDVWAWALSVAALVMAADQVMKQIIIDNVQRGDPIELGLGFELVNVRNKGVAFGLLSSGEAPVLAFTFGALALVLVYFALHADKPGLWASVGLLAGGALGNLADRVRVGAVTDFVDPPLWPAFNLADVAIVVGVALLALAAISTSPGRGEPA